MGRTLAPTEKTALSPKLAKVGTPGPKRGVMRPKAGPLGGVDPSAGTAVARRGIQERLGASHRITVNLPGPQSPEARMTQANGRIVNSYPKLGGNFQEQVGSYGVFGPS